jgi:imidazolonepropionase-like amidohydrolase
MTDHTSAAFRGTGPSPTNLLLVNVQIVDAIGTEVVGGAIWVKDGIIRALGTEAELREQATDEGDLAVIDLDGAFVAPGLINMHTHFSLALPGERGDYVRSLGDHGMALYMADGARRALHSGITSVRCVAENNHADFALRDAIGRGLLPGPDIYTAGQALVCTGGHGHESADTLECDGADGFARGVRTQIKAGADLIKVMISGGIAGKHEGLATPQLTKAEMESVISTAHAWGRKVTAHAGPAEIIAEAVELGLDCVEHGYELTPEVASAMAAQGTALVPTLVVTRCGSFFDELGVPAWMQERSLNAGPRHIESYRMAIEAGVTIMVGSDMPPFWPFEGTTAVVREMEHMSAFGLGAHGTLRAGTIEPAKWLGIDGEVGTIEVGKRANLIAMDDDPLLDTTALRGIRWVMKSGDVVRDDRLVIA